MKRYDDKEFQRAVGIGNRLQVTLAEYHINKKRPTMDDLFYLMGMAMNVNHYLGKISGDEV